MLERVLFAAGYPELTWKYANGEPEIDARGNPLFEHKPADPARINHAVALATLVALMLYATMVYGPIAAFLVELFPPKSDIPRSLFPIILVMGYSEECCRCSRPPSWRRRATFMPDFGIPFLSQA